MKEVVSGRRVTGSTTLTLNHILQFVCGADEEPAWGFPFPRKSDLYPAVGASFLLQTLALIHCISHLQAAQSVFLQMTYSLICMTMLLVAHTLELFRRFQ